MFIRIAAVTAVIATFMVVLADGRLVERVGLVGGCTAIAAPGGDTGSWQACRAGKLEGRPNLSKRSCVSAGVSNEIEYWRCPAPIVSSPKPDH